MEVVIRLIIGAIVGFIGGPLWLLVIFQVIFEALKYRRGRDSNPLVNIGAAIIGWIIGNWLQLSVGVN